jgi:hypothetical protein
MMVMAEQTKGRESGSVKERVRRIAGLEGDRSARIRLWLCSGEFGLKDACDRAVVVVEDRRKGRGFSCSAEVVAHNPSIYFYIINSDG